MAIYKNRFSKKAVFSFKKKMYDCINGYIDSAGDKDLDAFLKANRNFVIADAKAKEKTDEEIKKENEKKFKEAEKKKEAVKKAQGKK